MVGALAWICSDGVEPSRLPAPSTRPALESVPDGLPFRYYFVGNDGSFGYRVFDTAEEGSPDVQLFPGFGVAIRRERQRGSDPFGQSTHGLWIPLRDLRPVRAPEFGGVELENDVLDVLWVTEEGAVPLLEAGPTLEASRALALRRSARARGAHARQGALLSRGRERSGCASETCAARGARRRLRACGRGSDGSTSTSSDRC